MLLKINSHTSSPFWMAGMILLNSDWQALLLSVPVPGPVSVVTGAMHPFSSFRALFAG